MKKPKKSEFPLYCFDIDVDRNDAYMSIPIQMRMDDKKFRAVIRELNKILKPYGYSECCGGDGMTGLYDIHYTRDWRFIKWKKGN